MTHVLRNTLYHDITYLLVPVQGHRQNKIQNWPILPQAGYLRSLYYSKYHYRMNLPELRHSSTKNENHFSTKNFKIITSGL